jgi:hypothetical protein
MMDFSVRMMDDAQGLKDEAERSLEWHLKHAEKMKSWGTLDTFALCSDYCFNTNPFFSPDQFAEFVAPYLKRLIAGYREMGYYVIKHTDGNIMPIIDQMVQCHPHALHSLDPQGGVDIAKIDPERLTVNVVRPLPFRVTLGGAKDHCPLLFDDEGRMHLVKGIDNYETKKVPVAGKVTAYCQSKNTSSEAYGMSEGTIWVLDKGGVAKKLVGHRSRISKMKLYGNRLLSASYDGNLNLWIADREKVEPMPLLTINNWIMHFCFDSKKNSLWVGDAQGNLTSVNISVPYMVGIIKKKLKRNLTTEEWNYYIGENVPYESFIGSQGKEATP